MKSLFAAALALSLASASAAQAFTYNVGVLQTPTAPKHLVCWGIVADGPAQAVRTCVRTAFGVDLAYWAFDNQCRPWRSTHYTIHKDGTTLQYEYWIAAKPPYLQMC